MAYFYVIFCCLLLASICSAEKFHNISVDGDLFSEVSIISNFKEYQAKNANIEIIPLYSKETATPRDSRVLTLGRLNQYDVLLAKGKNRFSYTTPQDVRVELKYPISGIGRTVTYISIVVGTSSGFVNGYATAGGIGQRGITIAIEARSTTYLTYEATFYGSADRAKPFMLSAAVAMILIVSNRLFKL